jgi:hypothetical protein
LERVAVWLAAKERRHKPEELPMSTSIAITIFSMLLAIGEAQAAGRVFYDDFQNGNDKWMTDEFHARCPTVATPIDGGAGRSGMMLECNWNGTVAWNSAEAYRGLKLNSFPYSREFLIRFWLRYESDCDRTAGSKTLRLYPQNSKDSYYFTAQLEQTGGPMFSYWEVIDGKSGPLFYGDGQPFGDNKWHEVEIYVKHNTPGATDGIVRVWQDGKVKQSATNIVSISADAHWYPIMLTSNWSNNPGWEHDANNHVVWDDFEIYSDTGSGGSGSLADGTMTQGGTTPTPKTPRPPTALAATSEGRSRLFH